MPDPVITLAMAKLLLEGVIVIADAAKALVDYKKLVVAIGLRLDKLASIPLDAALHQLESAQGCVNDSNRRALLFNAHQSFTEAISAEARKEERLAAAYVGLAMCYELLDEQPNKITILSRFIGQRFTKPTIQQLQAAAWEKIAAGSNEPPLLIRGVDYSKLADLLQVLNWGEADAETLKVMEAAIGKPWVYVTAYELKSFPYPDLQAIDRLWVKHSNGQFGFSVQQAIYMACGARLDGEFPGDTIQREFCERVGWRVNGNNVDYSDLNFSTLWAPKGHLPASYTWLGYGGGWRNANRVSRAARLAMGFHYLSHHDL